MNNYITKWESLRPHYRQCESVTFIVNKTKLLIRYCKPKYWTNWTYDLIMVFDKKKSHQSSQDHECIILHGNVSDNRRDIWLRTKNVNLRVAQEEKGRGSPRSLGFILWGACRSVPKFMSMHPIAVEIFQFWPQWWTDWPTTWLTHISIPITMLLQAWRAS